MSTQTYDGAFIYITTIAAFKPGDVILTQNRHGSSPVQLREAELVAQKSGGDFSHVMICAGAPTFVEALADGVGTISLQASFCHDLRNVQVLRYRDDSIAEAAAAWALRFLGQRYSPIKARRALSGTDFDFGDDDGTFCSAFVANAFHEAGAPEFKVESPFKFTPASFQHLDSFQDITAHAFERALAPLNAETMNALDGDRILSPAHVQQVLYRNFLQVVEPDLDALFGEGSEGRPKVFFDCVEFLRRSFLKKPHPAREAHLSALDDHLLDVMSDGRLDRMLDEIMTRDAQSIYRILAESFNQDPDFDLQDLRRFNEATVEQISGRNAALGLPEQRESDSKAWKKWLAFSLGVIRQLEQRNVALTEVISRMERAQRSELVRPRLD